MKFFKKLLGGGPDLTPEQAGRLKAWRESYEQDNDVTGSLQRAVVVDVETSGLDPFRDRLIAIGAVEVVDSRIVCGRGFYAVLQQQKESTDENIIIHGIGGTAQREGGDPVEVLLSFLEFIGKAPLVGYNAVFDEKMIMKATRQYLGERFERDWLDLAWLAPALLGSQPRRVLTLDEWLKTFAITNPLRHHAYADAYVTAQLLMVLEDRAREKGHTSMNQLIELAQSQEIIHKHRP